MLLPRTQSNLGEMMKKIVFAVLFLLSTSASAEFQTGKITGYIPTDYNGKLLLLVQIEGNASGGCNATGRFAIDSSAPRYKSILAGLMAAFHAQTPVTISYSQTCNAFGNAWDLTYVCVGSIPC
jgi:hypothetical protein